VLVVLSDTHSRTTHELTDHLLEAVRDADRVVHAGDFTAAAALDAFHRATDRLEAVHGNADDPDVRDRLPADRVVTDGDARIAVRHRPTGGTTGLALFGREAGADLVVFGHTHRPQIVTDADPVLLNPGSHATPRGNRPGYATLERTESTLRGALRRPDGTVVDRFSVRTTDAQSDHESKTDGGEWVGDPKPSDG
jgi:hypothetical protein